MEYRNLGNSDLAVSEICLGSMTWGTQNSEAEGHAQIDYALDHGVNFIDTAELYPVNPMSAETVGRTEEIIGSWFARSGRRDAFILASKVAGNGHEYLQNGIDISPQKIRISLEGSLRRLQTDHIDLYQLHWPNRGTYHFRNNWRFDATRQDTQQTLDHIYSSLECLGQLVDEGKIRSIGLSNESCWGSAQFLRIATEHGFPRIVSLQNEYSLLYRTHDLDLAELSAALFPAGLWSAYRQIPRRCAARRLAPHPQSRPVRARTRRYLAGGRRISGDCTKTWSRSRTNGYRILQPTAICDLEHRRCHQCGATRDQPRRR
jgi:aryl-alcohol dehydrogenase-like predicted oxidoreductase